MLNYRILAVILIVVAGLVFLFATSLGGNTQQYVSIAELLQRTSDRPDETYKLKGKIAEGSIDYDPVTPKLTFDLNDGPGSQAVHIQSSELKPDNFKPGNECIVEGTLDRASSRFTATKVMTKCPSKYEGQEEPKTTQPQQ